MRLTSRVACLLVLATARAVYFSLRSLDQTEAAAMERITAYLPWHFSKRLLAGDGLIILVRVHVSTLRWTESCSTSTIAGVKKTIQKRKHKLLSRKLIMTTIAPRSREFIHPA